MAKQPHHMHALTKASAVHLHKAGHIPASKRDQIIKSADRGMKGAMAPAAPPMAPPQQPGPALGMPPGMGGMGGDE